MNSARAIAVIAGVLATVGVGSGQAQAQADCRGEVCITDLRTDGPNVHVAWTGNPRFVSYKVLWTVGDYLDQGSQQLGGDQFAFDIPDAKPGQSYQIEVSGCTPYIPAFATSPCGPTDVRTFTA